MDLPRPGERLCAALIALGTVALFCGVGWSLWRAQLHPDEGKLHKVGGFTNTLHAVRGTIYDRNGKLYPLAQTLPERLVFLDPTAIPEKADKHAAAEKLIAMGFNEKRVLAAVSDTKGRMFFDIGRTADAEKLKAIDSDPDMAHWVGTKVAYRRIYPYNERASHVVGAINSVEFPHMGVEKTFNDFLQGTNGLVEGVKDRRGREIRERRKRLVPPRNGCDIHLSIDEHIQETAERALSVGMTNFYADSKCSCKAAWAVVQDCLTGEILALVSMPNFSCAAFGDSSPSEQCNHALVDVYEPGSIMKPIVAAAAIEEKLVSPNTMLDVRPGLYGGKPLHDHIRAGVTEMSVEETLARSSNRGATRLGMMLGKDRQQAYFKNFGFGRRTGIELGGEACGATIGDGSNLNHLRTSIGQGMTVTAMQLVGAYSAMANGGRLMKPILVKEIVDPDGNTVFKAEPQVASTPISEKTASTMREMMSHVAVRGEGTARRAAIPGYTICGKTGTATKVIRGHYVNNKNFSSFVGFYPKNEPRLTILVTFDEPSPQADGGVCAAPVFAKIAAECAEYLRLPPDDESALQP